MFNSNWTAWALLFFLCVAGGCEGPNGEKITARAGSVQVIELNNTVISGAKEVKIINLLGGVAGVPTLNYREGIDLIDSMELRQAKNDLTVTWSDDPSTKSTFRLVPSLLGFRAKVNYSFEITNQSNKTYDLVGYGSVVAITEDSAGKEVVLFKPSSAIRSEQWLTLGPGEKGEMDFRATVPLKELNEKARVAGLRIDEDNFHFVGPNDGLSWRPNWPVGVTQTVGLNAEVQR